MVEGNLVGVLAGDNIYFGIPFLEQGFEVIKLRSLFSLIPGKYC